MSELVVGVFVGGQSRRMGSPKGLLRAPGGSWSLLDRLRWAVKVALPHAPLALMGTHPAYRTVPLSQLTDAVEGAGPVGGLLALVRWARARGSRRALALACDMPHVTPGLLARLATSCPNQANLAARVDGRWQPFFARYEPISTEATIVALLGQGRRGMTGVLDALRAQPLPLGPGEAHYLRDWDTPDDVEL